MLSVSTSHIGGWMKHRNKQYSQLSNNLLVYNLFAWSLPHRWSSITNIFNRTCFPEASLCFVPLGMMGKWRETASATKVTQSSFKTSSNKWDLVSSLSCNVCFSVGRRCRLLPAGSHTAAQQGPSYSFPHWHQVGQVCVSTATAEFWLCVSCRYWSSSCLFLVSTWRLWASLTTS